MKSSLPSPVGTDFFSPVADPTLENTDSVSIPTHDTASSTLKQSACTIPMPIDKHDSPIPPSVSASEQKEKRPNNTPSPSPYKRHTPFTASWVAA